MDKVILSPKLWQVKEIFLHFYCPGCLCLHEARIDATPGAVAWTGTVMKPTFHPSIRSRGRKTCRVFVTSGKLQYLAECDHIYAGQTIEMVDIPAEARLDMGFDLAKH